MKATRDPEPRPADRILAVVRAARDAPPATRYDVEIANGADRVPAVLAVPHADHPVPAALLLHGFGSTKERMANTVGAALVRRGIAALAVDLPLHGERPGSARDLGGADLMRLIGVWQGALAEARLAVAYLESHPAIAAGRIAVVGYSLGSFIANVIASEDDAVRAVVLAASGDLPDGLPLASLVRRVVDPLRAVRRLQGRPLLMINGRFDRTVTPSQAERLFAAAAEPKTMRWYGGGHWPPAAEVEGAAGWLAETLRAAPSRPGARRPRTRASSGA